MHTSTVPQAKPQPQTLALAAMLAGYLASRPRRPFNWQQNNCCHFAAGWVELVMGAAPMQGLPAMPNAQAAIAVLRQLGGSFRKALVQRLGAEPVDAAHADVGDLVLFTQQPHTLAGGIGALVGICCGGNVACLTPFGDVVYLSLCQADCAWHLASVAPQTAGGSTC